MQMRISSPAERPAADSPSDFCDLQIEWRSAKIGSIPQRAKRLSKCAPKPAIRRKSTHNVGCLRDFATPTQLGLS